MKQYIISGLVWVLFLSLGIYFFFPSADRIRSWYESKIKENNEVIEQKRQLRYMNEKAWKTSDEELSGAINTLKGENDRLSKCRDSLSLDCEQAFKITPQVYAEQDKPTLQSGLPPRTGILCTIGTWSHDVRHLAHLYPWVAGWKNNNPSGITLGSKDLERAFDQAGILWHVGTARPAKEGSNYYGFPDLENGMKAKLLIVKRSYKKSSIASYLRVWWTDAINTHLDTSRTIESLSDDELISLMKDQIRKESWALAEYIFENVIVCI